LLGRLLAAWGQYNTRPRPVQTAIWAGWTEYRRSVPPHHGQLSRPLKLFAAPRVQHPGKPALVAALLRAWEKAAAAC